MLGFHVGPPSVGLSLQARDMPITQKSQAVKDLGRGFWWWIRPVLDGIRVRFPKNQHSIGILRKNP